MSDRNTRLLRGLARQHDKRRAERHERELRGHEFAMTVVREPSVVRAGIGAGVGAVLGWPTRIVSTTRQVTRNGKAHLEVTMDVTLLGLSLFPKIPLPEIEGGLLGGKVGWKGYGLIPDTVRIIEDVDLTTPDTPTDPEAVAVAESRARAKLFAATTGVGTLIGLFLGRRATATSPRS